MVTNTQLYSFIKENELIGKGGATFRSYCGLGSGQPWCAALVSYIFGKGGAASLFYGGKKVTYCPNAIKWCEANLAEVPIYLALPMDIIFFDWNGNNVPDHIGFVKERKSADSIYTIEGNTSGGIVAEKIRTLYNEKGTIKYIQGVYRPHFPAKFDTTKALEIDGYFGYNSIACLQKVLKVDVDGIFGLNTCKAWQKKIGVTADGAWGIRTTKAAQKFLGVKVDGYFGPESVKAMQKWINKSLNFPVVNSEKKPETAVTPKPAPAPAPVKTKQEKMVEWAKKIAADNTWHYVKWNSKDAKTKECPICKNHAKGKYHGWNCIGFAFASWHHGAGIKCKCNNHVISNDKWEDILNAKTDAKALKMVRGYIGINDVQVIRNKNGIPKSQLKPGDICGRFDGKKNTCGHIFLYVGNGMMADARGSNGKIPNDKQISIRKTNSCKVAIRYIGK